MTHKPGEYKRIPLTQLRVGMYVAGMDCSWFRTPFLKHRFLVQSVEQIERLQRSNIHDIDPSRGLDVTTFPIADGNPSHDWLTHLYPSTSCTEGTPLRRDAGAGVGYRPRHTRQTRTVGQNSLRRNQQNRYPSARTGQRSHTGNYHRHANPQHPCHVYGAEPRATA